MGTYRYKISQIYMVEFEEHELDVGVLEDQMGVGILETIGTFQTHLKKIKNIFLPQTKNASC
jgi:hypothetical protein